MSNQSLNQNKNQGANTSLDELEQLLMSNLDLHLQDLKGLEMERETIGNPQSLSDAVMSSVWDQLMIQIGGGIGKEFISKNNNQTLDLSNSAHIQTAENFERGKIATHNRSINYQERYNAWQGKFERDAFGNIKMHNTRTGKQEANLQKGVRKIFDENRPSGSVERHIDMDHTISAGEMIRRSDTNAFMTEAEQIDFANSRANLMEMDSSHNRSKSDMAMKDWLDTPNANGQKPSEIFDIDKQLDKEYRSRDKEARRKLEQKLKKGEEDARKTGKSSQMKEAKLLGKQTVKAVLFALIAELLKDVGIKLVHWFRSANRSFESLIFSLKTAITRFFTDFKARLNTIGNVAINVIVTAIFDPIKSLFQKLWLLLKQGFRSVKEVFRYRQDPENKKKPLSVKMAEISKIIVAGLSAGGAIFLGEAIEKAMITAYPGLATPIPILGSVASILGMLLGALVSGIIGSIVLYYIDKWIEKKRVANNIQEQIAVTNEILQVQEQIKVVSKARLEEDKEQAFSDIAQRHSNAEQFIRQTTNEIQEHKKRIDNTDSLVELFGALDKL